MDLISFGYKFYDGGVEINNSNEEIFQAVNRQDKCSFCQSNKIVIHRRYSGERLCANCFIKAIEKNISTTISRYRMLTPDDKVAVAISGGKDSISLLYNIYKIQRKQYGAKEIIALTIDEGISEYRDKSILLAKKFCKEYNIEHKIISFKESFGKTLDQIVLIKRNNSDYHYACNYCATLRRRILNEAARKIGADKLAMGHNLTDLAETYLMNILFKRYEIIGNQYLFKQEASHIQKYFIRKITPLMRIPEDEITLYSDLKRFDYYPYHCPYRDQDPILRKRVLEFIQSCKSFSPEIEFNLLNGFLEISEILCKNSTNKKYKVCDKCGYPCGNTGTCLYCKYFEEFNM